MPIVETAKQNSLSALDPRVKLSTFYQLSHAGQTPHFAARYREKQGSETDTRIAEDEENVEV